MGTFHLRRFTLLLLILMVLAAVPAGGAAGQADSGTHAIDTYIRSEMAELQIPGLALAIVYQDQVIYTQGYGPAVPTGTEVTPQTPMILGSVSKGLTALAVMQLVEAGKVNLDAPVSTYLPWFRLAGGPNGAPPEAWKQITVRQLLHHTSGIPEYAGAATWDSTYNEADALEKLVRSFAEFSLARIPGSGFEYSNANYETLGLIVQAVSGESYAQYLDKHIFGPLEMRSSTALAAQAPGLATGHRFWFEQLIASPEIPAPPAHAPSAFLASSADDMGRYLVAQVNGGKFRDTRVLSAAGIAEMQRAGVQTGAGRGYAMGWVVEPDGRLSHLGKTASFTSGISIQGDWGVFMVCNIAASQIEQRLNEIVPGLLAVVQGQTPLKNTPDPTFQRINIALGVLLVLLALNLLWCLFRLVFPPYPPRPLARALGLAAGLTLNLGAAALLLYLGPISGHRPFSVLAQSAPDQYLLLGSGVALALVNGALHVVQLLRRA